MATIVCNNINCPYLGGNASDATRFCRANSIAIINGVCRVFFKPNGQPNNFCGEVHFGTYEQDAAKYVHKPEPIKEENNEPERETGTN